MAIKPLTEWFCDSCGEKVTGETGWLEWVEDNVPGKPMAKEFHIVHNTDKCQRHTRKPGRKDNHLHYFVGPNGLQRLLEIADNCGQGKHSMNDLSEFALILRRLHVPYFEEARVHFNQYAADTGSNLHSLYSTETNELKDIAQKYTRK